MVQNRNLKSEKNMYIYIHICLCVRGLAAHFSAHSLANNSQTPADTPQAPPSAHGLKKKCDYFGQIHSQLQRHAWFSPEKAIK